MNNTTDEERQSILSEAKDLLCLAQNGSKIAEEQLIVLIRDKFMRKRISRYLHRNRQVEDEDLKQEFLIGVALNISRAKLDIGDPIEYIITQGVYRVRSFLRTNIIHSTSQICNDCGHITRLNKVGENYICKKCGSDNITTQEINENNDILLENVVDKENEYDDVISNMIIDEFEKTLNPNTNVHNLYELLKNGINRDNPLVKNYIKEIAKIWGGCSDQNVIQNMDKLKNKMIQFAHDNNIDIKDGTFVIIE